MIPLATFAGSSIQTDRCHIRLAGIEEWEYVPGKCRSINVTPAGDCLADVPPARRSAWPATGRGSHACAP